MRRELLLMVALVTVALGLGACSDQFEHVGSAADATGTAKSSSVGGSAPVSVAATPTRSASLVRVPAQTREQLQGCSTPGKRLCLVAFGDFPDDLLQVWANHLRATYGIEVEVLAPVDALDAWNPDRQQVLAEGAVDVVLRQYPALNGEPDASMIVVTALDMNTRDIEPFIFGITTSNPRYGIVSGYHMNPVNRGDASDEALYEQRMFKLVTKYVGMTYFHLPTSSDMSSLMYGPINSIAILDRVPKELPQPLPK